MDFFSNQFKNLMSGNLMKNYLDLTLVETYKVLTSGVNPWPSTFRSYKKVKLIDQLIQYFQDREEYEKCAELVKIKNKVTDELENRESSN
tara:strand:- start:245 stop:514 length:270 start_codon:yes stop_codon:yes gene_type:complete